MNENNVGDVSTASSEQNESLETSSTSENDVTIVQNTAENDSKEYTDASDISGTDLDDTRNDPNFATRANVQEAHPEIAYHSHHISIWDILHFLLSQAAIQSRKVWKKL